MKPWNELTIRDNFIFSKVMRNKTICKTVVENLLGIRVHDIQFLEYERTLKEGIRSKGIRMDIFICTFDPFRKGLPMYSFEYRCEEYLELKEDNGQHDIYFNALAFDKIREKSVEIVELPVSEIQKECSLMNN